MRVYGESFIGEKFVSHIWDGGHFAKDALRAKDGRKIEVISRGQWNYDSGADFRNAEIKVGDQVQKGDVEIHVRYSHWRVHHHDVNPRYNSTILHVVMWDDGIKLLTRKQNGELIPTLILCDYLDSSIGKLWKTIEGGEEEPSPCRTKAETMTLQSIGKVLDRAGMDRFARKTKVFGDRLQEIGEDQLLYEGIMEALGYSKNKKPFLELARKVPLENLMGQPPKKIQAILFGVAGLLPSQSYGQVTSDEETEEYVSKIEALWKPSSSQFKSQRMSEEQWEFFRTRPENFPTRRISGISYIISNSKNGNGSESLLSMFLPSFEEGDKVSRSLRKILMPRASGYWTNHYTFGGRDHREKTFLIGHSRAADIVINVILPVVSAYARRLRNEELQQAVTAVYTKHARLQDNKITRYLAGQIFSNREECSSVVNSAMRQQGLIHIYRSFCTAGDCRNCPLTGTNM